MMELQSRRAGLGWMSGDRELVAGFEYVFAEAGAGQQVRIAQFCAPVDDVALIVGNIKQNAAMRVGPNPSPKKRLLRGCRSWVEEMCNSSRKNRCRPAFKGWTSR